MTPLTKSLIERVASWPQEDVKELDEVARDIEARRTGVYRLSDDERVAVREGMAQIERGEVVSEAEMDALWKRLGA